MKDYTKRKLGLTFQDERVQLMFDFIASKGRTRRQLKKIIKLMPKECLQNIMEGKDFCYKDDEKEIIATYHYDKFSSETGLGLEYVTTKKEYHCVIHFGFLGKDKEFAKNIWDESYFEVECLYNKKEDGEFVDYKMKGDLYSITGNKYFLTNCKTIFGEMDITIFYPYFKMNRMNKMLSALPYTFEEYQKMDLARVKEKVEYNNEQEQVATLSFEDMLIKAQEKSSNHPSMEDTEELTDTADMGYNC